jgi:aspartate/methionine/tyrosine aminotransferase
VIARIHDANPQGDLGVSKLAHAIAALVLEDLAPFDAHWRDVLAAGRPMVQAHADAMVRQGLIEGALPPEGCMYFPRIVGVDDTRALAEWLWSEHGVLVAAGEFFGQAGHVRIGFGGGRPEALDRGLARLAIGLAAYPGRR